MMSVSGRGMVAVRRFVIRIMRTRGKRGGKKEERRRMDLISLILELATFVRGESSLLLFFPIRYSSGYPNFTLMIRNAIIPILHNYRILYSTPHSNVKVVTSLN